MDLRTVARELLDMHRTTLMLAAAALCSVAVSACGSDGATSYEATRQGNTAPPRDTRPRDTRPPRSDPSTPGTIVLPTFPSTSSTDEPPSTIPAAGDITIGDTWFQDDGFGGIDWGLTFESTAASASVFVPVRVEFFDAAGSTIGTADTSIPLVIPGKAAFADYAYDLDGTPASMEVTIGDGDDSEFQAAGGFTVGGVAFDAAASTLSGQITSTYPTDLEDVSTVAVWRGADGAVTGIAADNVRLVQANGVTWFSVIVPTGATGDPAEVYVTPRPPYAVAAPDASLSVTESWFQADGTGGYNWAAILTNAGPTTWSGPYVVAKFFDADNRLLDSEGGYFGVVRPGKSAVVGFTWDTPAAPARMEVVLVDGGYDDDPEPGDLTVSDLVVAPGDVGTATVTGTVTSSFASEQSFVEVVLIWRDASNTLVYAASAYPDAIPAGGSAPFELTLYGDNLPTTPPTETYWSV